MKPFLILQLRPEDAASDNEFEAFLKFGGLAEHDAHRVRMEGGYIPPVQLEKYSGVLVGGGPFNVSDGDEKKSEEQKRAEAALRALLGEIVEKDIPYLGACYGLGILSLHCGGVVSKEQHAEDVGGVTIALTEEGMKDPLLEGLPKEFRAFVGHKEACQGVPEGAVLLASSEGCPTQMIRVKNNIYATQFHPELDAEGINVRINVYKHAGYFPPEDAEKLREQMLKEDVNVPMKILKRFVEKYWSK